MQMDHLEITEIAFTDLKDISISEELMSSEIVLKLH